MFINYLSIHLFNYYISISKPSNLAWAACPHGYFLQGFFRSNDTWLHNIKQATCCKPKNFKSVNQECYDHNVTVAITTTGWSKCHDWSYLVGVYKGVCNKLHCIKAFRCCRMPPPGIFALHSRVQFTDMNPHRALT